MSEIWATAPEWLATSARYAQYPDYPAEGQAGKDWGAALSVGRPSHGVEATRETASEYLHRLTRQHACGFALPGCNTATGTLTVVPILPLTCQTPEIVSMIDREGNCRPG